MGPGEISIPAAQYDVEGAYPPDVIWAYPLDSEWDSFPIGYIDDCSGFFTLHCRGLPLSGGCANQPHPMYNSESATYLRVLTITDLCGNSSTAEVIINLIDEDAPAFEFIPEDYTVSCAEDVVLLDPIVSDLVDENLDIEYEAMMELSCANDYLLIRHWTVTDNCDNSVEAEQIITVKDEIAPSIDAGSSGHDHRVCRRLQQQPSVGQLVGQPRWSCRLTTVTATSWSMSPAAPALSDDCGNTGSVTVTFTATDMCGNASSTTATFTVEDTTAPVITAEAADETIECGSYDYVVIEPLDTTFTEITQIQVIDSLFDEEGMFTGLDTMLVDEITYVDSTIMGCDLHDDRRHGVCSLVGGPRRSTGADDACGDVT